MKILSWLTGLRGLAALIVVIYHLNQQRSIENLSSVSWWWYQFVSQLDIVVSVFFVMGGFFRSLPYWKVVFLWEEKVPSFFPSLLERFKRIAPLYYIALVSTFVVFVLFSGYTQEWLFRFLVWFSFFSWVSSASLFPIDLNGPLWFIAFDMMGWILISLVMMGALAIRKSWIWVYLLFVGLLLFGAHSLWISLPWSPTPWLAGVWFPVYNPFLFGLHFLVGWVAGWLVTWFYTKKVTAWYFFDVLGFLVWVGFISFLWGIRDIPQWQWSWPQWPYHFPFATILIMLLFVVLPFTRYLWRWFDNGILRFFARISYPLFLFHMLVIFFLRKYAFPVEQLSIEMWIIFSLATILIASLISWILVGIFEKSKKV